jgi:TolB-like protein/Flp pilus assembly protein TadD
VQRCLEKAPSDRFQSVRDLEFALKEARGAGTTAPERAAAAVRRGRYRPIAITAIATLLVAAIGAGAYAYFTQLRRPADAAPIGALAVLPLRNLSDDPEQEYFADGMTEALIASLSRVGGVRVISRTSTMTFKAAASTLRLPQIAGQLRVDAVVEGSVIRVGDRVRITVQLVRANTDTPMWSKDYDRDLRDVLGLQSEVARAIAQEIKVTLTPQEQSRLAAAPAVDRLAHEHYLRGRYFLARATEDGLNKAIRAFTASVQADPTSARPHAGLADAYTLLRSTYLPPRLVMPKAKAAAARALELDPDLAEAHVSMGGVLMFYDFDWAGAERELRRAIELAPNLADAHDYYAMYLAAMGRHEEARLESDRAMALDPLSLAILDSAAWDRYLARDYPGGLALAQRALELDPNYWPAMRDAGLLYEKLGRFPEAIAALEKARRLDSNASILEMLAGAYAAWGKEAEARKVLAELTARSASQYVCPYEVATVYASLGDKTAAVDWLEKAHRDRADCMPWTRSDAKLDVIRGYPAFEAIMQRMGFPR